MIRKALAIAFVAMVLLFLLPAPGCGQKTGQLTLFESEPSALDPALCGDATSARYLVEIFSGLVTLNSELEVVPDIASSWEVSSDGMTYTFHLREGVRFQNGREVTASDFKYSIERAADPDTHSPVAEAYLGDILGVKEKLRGEAEEVSGVVVIDKRTLQITIDAPKAYFLSKLAHPTAFVVDSENVGGGTWWWEQPNGTGPFRLVEWKRGQSLVLERNERFYRGVPMVDRVTFLFTGNAMMMYENGQIDITPVGILDIERVLDPANPLSKELVVVPELSVTYIGFNTGMAPFNDSKVRQAFCHAVVKDKLVEVLLKGTVITAYGILPPGIPGYNEGLDGLKYDVALARQLIDDSSYDGVLPPVVLAVPGSCGGVASSTLAAAWMWEENLGVDIEIEVVEWDTFLDDLRDRQFQAFQVAWIADYADAENFLDLLFHSDSVENHTSYSNPLVDQLLERARVEDDSDNRLAAYSAAEQAIVEDAPVLPVWFNRSYYLVKPYVKGFGPAPMVIPTYKDVWIEK